MSSNVRSEYKAEGSMTLRQFADREGIEYGRARQLFAERRIIGATQLHNKRIVVFPPAKIRGPEHNW